MTFFLCILMVFQAFASCILAICMHRQEQTINHASLEPNNLHQPNINYNNNVNFFLHIMFTMNKWWFIRKKLLVDSQINWVKQSFIGLFCVALQQLKLDAHALIMVHAFT